MKVYIVLFAMDEFEQAHPLAVLSTMDKALLYIEKYKEVERNKDRFFRYNIYEIKEFDIL